jgi:hypothetical protein
MSDTSLNNTLELGEDLYPEVSKNALTNLMRCRVKFNRLSMCRMEELAEGIKQRLALDEDPQECMAIHAFTKWRGDPDSLSPLEATALNEHLGLDWGEGVRGAAPADEVSQNSQETMQKAPEQVSFTSPVRGEGASPLSTFGLGLAPGTGAPHLPTAPYLTQSLHPMASLNTPPLVQPSNVPTFPQITAEQLTFIQQKLIEADDFKKWAESRERDLLANILEKDRVLKNQYDVLKNQSDELQANREQLDQLRAQLILSDNQWRDETDAREKLWTDCFANQQSELANQQSEIERLLSQEIGRAHV